MDIYKTAHNFGVRELAAISSGSYDAATLQRSYLSVAEVRRHDSGGDAPILLASLTDQQIAAREFVLANGFIQIGVERVNPNSGNKVAIYLKKQEPSIINEAVAAKSYDAWRNWCCVNRPRIFGTNISCSTYYIGEPALIKTQNDYDAILRTNKPQCAYIITSVALDNTATVKVLEDNKFFKVEEFDGYYKDIGRYGLFMRYVYKAEREKHGCSTKFDLEGYTD